MLEVAINVVSALERGTDQAGPFLDLVVRIFGLSKTQVAEWLPGKGAARVLVRFGDTPCNALRREQLTRLLPRWMAKLECVLGDRRQVGEEGLDQSFVELQI